MAGGFVEGFDEFYGLCGITGAGLPVVVFFDFSHAMVKVEFADGFIDHVALFDQFAASRFSAGDLVDGVGVAGVK